MKLAFAQACAERLIERFSPLTSQIVVAGSIRRSRAECGDVDLVAIPKTTEQRDMFGVVTSSSNLLAEAIRRDAKREGWAIERDGEQYLVFTARGVQVDIWFATPETWGTLLLCRTGSAQHNIWLCELAKARGGHWNPHHGLRLPGLSLISRSETDIYAALGLPWIPPENRDEPAFRALARHAIPA